VIRLIFTRFRELGSARQVLISMKADRIHFPRPSDEGRMTSSDWVAIRCPNVIAVLKESLSCRRLRLRESEKRTSIVDGRARRSYVMIKDHHEGYIGWAEFECNQKQLALNN